jgi:hypothetical protein
MPHLSTAFMFSTVPVLAIGGDVVGPDLPPEGASGVVLNSCRQEILDAAKKELDPPP